MERIIDIFVAGKDDFGSYRIPSIILTRNGALLAFAEGRKELNDHAQNKIVLKRSMDTGHSWDKLQIIADAGMDSLNNPLAVQIEENGKIILMYQSYPHTRIEDVSDPEQWKSHEGQEFSPNIHEAAVQTGYEGMNICRSFIISSEDDGNTWSLPIEITREVKRPVDVTNYAGGPGIGIQVRKGNYKGRVIMPFSQGPWSDMKVYAVYSDDNGDSWKYGETAPNNLNGMPNEVQIAELSDGKLIMNARTFKGQSCRMISNSLDGGETWTDLSYDETLEDPGCQGSILSMGSLGPSPENILLFSNPADKSKRVNGTIRLSDDEGKSWKWSKTLYKGSFGYSCLAALSDTEFGILYERDDYVKISYTRLDIKWLKR